jgi:hypothetical protein
MIYDLFWKHKVISFKGCVTQIFFIHNIGHVEMVLLLSMSLLCTQPYVSLCTTWPSWAQEYAFFFSFCQGGWLSALCGSADFCTELTILRS